jgi:Glyoxalase-like domain
MRFRQVAFVADVLEPAVDEVRAILGLEVCYQDPNVGKWGLTNALFPLGNDFLEIVAPHQTDTSAGRYLARRGGNGGYMAIFQSPDARVERERIAGMGVSFIHEADRPGPYHATQFHPKYLGGILASIESCGLPDAYRDPAGPWYPAGTAWKPHVRTDRVRRLLAVELQAENPQALAGTWSRVLNVPVTQDGQGRLQLQFENLPVRCVHAEDGRGTGVGALDVEAADPKAILAAAEARSLKRSSDQVMVCGVRVNLR